MSARAYLARARLVPVVTIDDAARAADLSCALGDAGIRCAEVTLRTPAAWDAITEMVAVADETGVDVGVGTVLSADEVTRAHAAGAHFIVSPGFDPATVARAHDLGLACLPGVATASEAMAAQRAGCDTVKVFPAGLLGGVDYIDALSAPLVDLGFVPSGGVNPTTAAGYLAHRAVPAVSGSWMVRRDDIAKGRFDTIRAASFEAAALVGLA
ncbi:bifunctional 4-hydroxy-2-oxoglutarate aldolase/2-dehydro-3-deoxy-phosphogluconate aldolase [Microbacterium sediminicola]|uniref:2-dehydro-3-deoxy-phosphogluconate aldolase n=1 Tax=Microbacterium sediminicola TaxID=415210 RepID=A0ABP4UE47_9MICO